MTQLGFRARLFLILALFAIAPALLITLAWGGTMTRLLPLMAGKAAWDTVSTTGEQALAIAKRAARTPADSTMIAEHGRALATAQTRSLQFELLTEKVDVNDKGVPNPDKLPIPGTIELGE